MTQKTKAKPPASSTVAATEPGKADSVAPESNGKGLARVVLGTSLRHGLAASGFVTGILAGTPDKPDMFDYADVVKDTEKKAEGGDLGLASRMLAAQALTLDSMFTELARRSAINMGEYIGASEKYGRLALKAQSNCRATLEALAKLHQPREQTVKHVHVNEGGQAVVADHFHQNMGGQENGKTNEQPYATGTGAAGTSPALPSPDPLGNGVPIPSRAGQTAMQDARRQ